MLMERRVLFAPGGFGAKCTTLRAMAKTYRPYVPERDVGKEVTKGNNHLVIAILISLPVSVLVGSVMRHLWPPVLQVDPGENGLTMTR
jgi:hypothetical protein